MEQTHQPHHVHPKKRFSEEEALEKAEKKLDEKMEKIINKGFVGKFLHIKFIKDIIGSQVVTDINHKISPYLKTIFTIVGWISLITGIIGVFSFLISLSGLGFMFSLGFGIGVRVLVYILLAFAFSLLSLFTGIGLIRLKKRAISLIVLGFFVSAIIFLISLIPVGLYSYTSYGTVGGSVFNLIITFVLLLLAVKNQPLFKH